MITDALPAAVRVGAPLLPRSLSAVDAWHVETGERAAHGTGFSLMGKPAGAARLKAFPQDAAGGDIVNRLRFRVVDGGDDWQFRCRCNVYNHTVNILTRAPLPGDGISIATEDSLCIGDASCTAHLHTHHTAVDWRPEPGRLYELEIVAINRYREVRIDGVTLAAHWSQTPWVCCEGKTWLEADGCTVEVEAFDILDASWDVSDPDIVLGPVCYADDFTDPARTRQDWVYELKKEGDSTLPPIVEDGWLCVDRYSAVWCRHRTEGPVAYCFDCLPIPKAGGAPESITDAIFLFQTDWYQMPFDFFCRKHYDWRHSVYGDLTGYWIDWGGNDNATTRLRKLPYRQLLRQNVASEDQLQPDHCHAVTIICAGNRVRLIIDGRIVLDGHDLQPPAGGHFGMLGFVRGNRIRNFRIHQL
jgi:hypothetical protein